MTIKKFYQATLLLLAAALILFGGYLFKENYALGQSASPLTQKDSAAQMSSTAGSNGNTWPPFFYDYKNWPQGAYAKPDDWARIALQLLRGEGYDFAPPHHHFVDINGDSLVDVLYYYQSEWQDEFYAILVNDGKNNFEVVYKCLYKRYDQYYDNQYYGDCAASEYSTGSGGVFDYSWPSSNTPKADDYLRYVLEFTTASADKLGNRVYQYQFLDVNGDGLNDIVYSYADDGDYGSSHTNYMHALLLNNGAYGFDPVYRCIATIGYFDGTYYGTYKGDCADL